MIKFAIKSLVVMVLVGHAIKLVEPVEQAQLEPRFMSANYTEGAAQIAEPDITGKLSTFTNAQIVVSHAAQDTRRFCDREPLACQAGRELLARAAVGIRDVASGIAAWADGPGEEDPIDNPDTEYRPLEKYQGAYPILPTPPPARNDTL